MDERYVCNRKQFVMVAMYVQIIMKLPVVFHKVQF